MALWRRDLGRAFRNNTQLQQFMLADVTPTGRILGTGSYGSVEEVTHKHLTCAAKRIHEILIAENEGVPRVVQNYLQECQLMSTLRHPNITLFFGICFLPDTRLPLLVMEQLETSLDDLLEYMPGLPLSLKRSVLEDVASGLVYLHDRRPPVIHRDLTAKNILLTSSLQAKITDMGNSCIVNMRPGQMARTLSQFPGTLTYMPPEALDDTHCYGPSLDIFSFGHLSLFTLTQVFPGNLLPATRRRSEVDRRLEYIEILEADYSRHCPGLVTLVKECLHNVPDQRPAANEVLARLKMMRVEVEGQYGGNLMKLDIGKVLLAKDMRMKDKRIEELTEQEQRHQAVLQEKTRELEGKTRELERTTRELERVSGELERESRRARGLQGELEVKDRRICELLAQIREKDLSIATKDRSIQAKDSQVQELQREIGQLQNEKEEMEYQLREELQNKEAEMEDKLRKRHPHWWHKTRWPTPEMQAQINDDRVFTGGDIQLVDQQTFAEVSTKFGNSWSSAKGTPPPVINIFAITNQNLERKWRGYKQTLRFRQSEEHYHGATLSCNIAVSNRLCNNEDCGICGIAYSGFNPGCIGKKANFERFGSGFYLAPNSSKCHDYTEGHGSYRAILLCDVLPGRKYTLMTGDEELTEPPPGYNSVYGQCGRDLNFPEIVVYKPEAIMPRFIIVYERDGTHRIAGGYYSCC